MCPLVSRLATLMRASFASYSAKMSATWASDEQSSAMQSSQFVVELRPYRLDGGPQKVGRRVVDRHDDR